MLSSTENNLFKIIVLKAPVTNYTISVGGYEFSEAAAYVELLLIPNPQHEALV